MELEAGEESGFPGSKSKPPLRMRFTASPDVWDGFCRPKGLKKTAKIE
jgi:hypothetical protein